ncbi:MAG: S53 family peptidase [Candidatus Vogelbacteria bacterium]|nr:S53 family peptidase [Candidatus Vogelbacteria bacterium]
MVDSAGQPKTQATPSGYGPAQLHGAYTSQVLAPNKQIIAIVDAYDDPNILSDLNTYNKTYNIPLLPTCSSAVATSLTPCFQKLDQRGGIKYPAVDAGWALEISLDVEAAHAICQNCSILLIEADSASYINLMAAVDRAITSGATVVSNSYGSSEFSGETDYDTHFNHLGVAFTFSSGDGGYGVEYPAASQYVTAVGGTTLLLNSDNSYKSESAWSGAGSGCSLYGTKPLWQHDTYCLNRTVADISAVADPNTGVAVYDSIRYQNKSGWFKVGGTSLAAPVVAGIYSLAGGVSSGVQGDSLPYSNGSYLTNIHDILTGSNGTCGGSYLCTATVGFDGPTGLGSPIGISAF